MARPEDRLQMRARMYLDDALPPPAWWSSIGHERKQSVQSGQRQKARGVKRGISDILIVYKRMLYCVELKAGTSVTEPQAAFGAAMRANGFRWTVVRSVVELHDYLCEAGIPIPLSHRVAALRHDAALQDVLPAPKDRGGRRPRERPTARAIAISRQAQLP